MLKKKNGYDRYLYDVGIIDFFEGCIKLDNYVDSEESIVKRKDIYEMFLNELEILGESLCNLRDRDIYVFSIPSSDFECEIGIIFKLDNNGQTFVSSPVPVTWIPDITMINRIGK